MDVKHCKFCEHPDCKYAKTYSGIATACSSFVAPQESQTNADRIRAMSDEELADALMKFLVESMSNSDCADLQVEFADGYRDSLLKLLRQPVKDGDN